MTGTSSPILAQNKGSIVQLVVATLPLFGVLVYFLYEASTRTKKLIYNLGDDYTYDQWNAAVEETGDLIRMMDMLAVFMAAHFVAAWLLFHMKVFVPRRRHLIGRYLSEGKECVGDVHYERIPRIRRINDYGYAIYLHPERKDGVAIRKPVRIYQSYTREKISILTLPGKPLSGQSKVDLEIDLLASSRERDGKDKAISALSIFWLIFSFFGAIFILHQMKIVHDPDEDFQKGMNVFICVTALTYPITFTISGVRYVTYRNWMLYKGRILRSLEEAKNPDGWIGKTSSADGSDFVPYSIMNEDDCSFNETLPEHELTEQRSFVPNV